MAVGILATSTLPLMKLKRGASCEILGAEIATVLAAVTVSSHVVLK